MGGNRGKMEGTMDLLGLVLGILDTADEHGGLVREENSSRLLKTTTI